ncbi:MAG: molybdopterin-guanine dinucleotide biosynthesis protein A [Planctomycetota bacterium]
MKGVLGLVLCGGESRRMGMDKALLDLAGSNLLQRAVDVITPLADEVFLGTGVAPRYPELGLECLLDVQAGVGPLAGLSSGLEALEARGAEWLVLVACDTPRLDTGLFRILLERAVAVDADACLLESDSGMEPMCAVYRRSCAGPVRAALQGGQRRMRSFHGDITVGLVQEHELPEPMRGKQLGFNVNTPVELAEEKARLEGKSNGANGGVRSARRVSKQTPGSDSETNEEVA